MTSLVPSSLRSRWLAAARGARSVGFGNPAQEQLLAAILKGFPSGDVVSATIGAPPTPDFKAFPAIGEVGETWLYVTVKANDRDYGTFFANWEAQLVAGAFREASWRMQLPNLLGVTTTAEYPDGARVNPGLRQ